VSVTRVGNSHVSALAPLSPTEVYDTYWRFAAERQQVFYRRIEAPLGVWTTDRIIRRHKFTNVYRASDRVSQFLIRNVIYKGDNSPREIFFRTLLFKFFNKIETWELLAREVGEVSWQTYHFDRYRAPLEDAMRAGIRIYSPAYIMPAASRFSGPRKHETHLRLLEHMIKESAPEGIARSRTMKAAFDLLRSFPMMGNFLAYQYLIDLNYSETFNFDEMEFVVPGPGARDGLRKCFSSIGGLSEADVIRLVTERQELEFERLGLTFRSLWGRPLQLIDSQNLFCEVDKYARIAHPDILGISGRTRIKQMFAPNPKPIAYWYPPKWGINERVFASYPQESA
jgi:hypothetical protein